LFLDVLYRFSTQFGVSALNFVTAIIVARYLGPAGKGTFVIITLTAGIMVTFGNLGLGQALLYSRAKKNYTSNELWTFSLLFALGWGCLLAVAAGGVLWFGAPVILKIKMNSLLVMGICAIPALLWIEFNRTYLMGGHQFHLYNLVDGVRAVSWFALAWIFLVTFENRLRAAVAAWLISVSLTGLVQLVLTWNPGRLQGKKAVAMGKDLFGYGLKTYVTTLLQFFNYRLDAFILNYFSTSAVVGIYSVAVALAETVWQLCNAVASIVFPKVSAMTHEQANRLTPITSRLTLTISFLMAVFLAAVCPWVIPRLYGEAFAPAVVPLWWLLPGVVTFGLVKILYGDLAGRGFPGVGGWVTGTALILTLLFDFTMIPRWQATGAAVASSISYTAAAGLCTFYFMKITGIPAKEVWFLKMSDIRMLKKRGGLS